MVGNANIYIFAQKVSIVYVHIWGEFSISPCSKSHFNFIRLPADKFLQSLSDGPTASQTTQKQNEIENVALKYTKSRDLKWK